MSFTPRSELGCYSYLLIQFLNIIVLRRGGVWRKPPSKEDDWIEPLRRLRAQLVQLTTLKLTSPDDARNISLISNTIHYNVYKYDPAHDRDHIELQRGFQSHTVLSQSRWWATKLNSFVQKHLVCSTIVGVRDGDQKDSKIITLQSNNLLFDLQCDSLDTMAAVGRDLQSQAWMTWCASQSPSTTTSPTTEEGIPTPDDVINMETASIPLPPAIARGELHQQMDAFNLTHGATLYQSTQDHDAITNVTLQVNEAHHVIKDLTLQLNEARDALCHRTKEDLIHLKRTQEDLINLKRLCRESMLMRAREADHRTITINLFQSIADAFPSSDARLAATSMLALRVDLWESPEDVYNHFNSALSKVELSQHSTVKSHHVEPLRPWINRLPQIVKTWTSCFWKDTCHLLAETSTNLCAKHSDMEPTLYARNPVTGKHSQEYNIVFNDYWCNEAIAERKKWKEAKRQCGLKKGE